MNFLHCFSISGHSRKSSYTNTPTIRKPPIPRLICEEYGPPFNMSIHKFINQCQSCTSMNLGSWNSSQKSREIFDIVFQLKPKHQKHSKDIVRKRSNAGVVTLGRPLLGISFTYPVTPYLRIRSEMILSLTWNASATSL